MLKETLEEGRKITDAALERLLPGPDVRPASIHRAMRHSVFAGGKRIRPILCMEAGRAVAGSLPKGIEEVGAALEMVHTYSLIHDDLPALDNDDLRRGVPTCHKVFGEAMAVLTGDALMTRGYQVLTDMPGVADSRRLAIIREVAFATGTVKGMIGGQVVDLESEGKPIHAPVLDYIHQSKTGALLTACTRCGAIAAGADEAQLCALTGYGRKIGLVFQIVDDILDITASSEKLGKTAGKDEKVKKATYPALFGIDSSRRKAQELVDEAVKDIGSLGPAAEPLRSIAHFVLSRTA